MEMFVYLLTTCFFSFYAFSRWYTKLLRGRGVHKTINNKQWVHKIPHGSKVVHKHTPMAGKIYTKKMARPPPPHNLPSRSYILNIIISLKIQTPRLADQQYSKSFINEVARMKGNEYKPLSWLVMKIRLMICKC